MLSVFRAHGVSTLLPQSEYFFSEEWHNALAFAVHGLEHLSVSWPAADTFLDLCSCFLRRDWLCGASLREGKRLHIHSPALAYPVGCRSTRKILRFCGS